MGATRQWKGDKWPVLHPFYGRVAVLDIKGDETLEQLRDYERCVFKQQYPWMTVPERLRTKEAK